MRRPRSSMIGATIVAACWLALVPLAVHADDWPMFRSNAARTGIAASPVAPSDNPAQRWSFATGGAITSSPAVVGNIVYFGSVDGSLYAVGAVDGKQQWKLPTGGPLTSSPAILATKTAPILFVGSLNGLYAIDTTILKPILIYTAGPVDSSPAIVEGADATGQQYVDIYFGTRAGTLVAVRYAVAGQTATQLWSVTANTAGPILSSPAVKDGKVYVGGQDVVIAIDAASGAEVGRFPVSGYIDAAPAVDDACVYVGTSGGVIAAIQVADPTKECWDVPDKSSLHSSAAVYADASGAHWLIVQTADGLLALKATPGNPWAVTQAWSRPETKPMTAPSSPAVMNGRVYVGGGNGVVYAFDATTGGPLWSFPIKGGAEISSSPAVVDGVVYVGSNDGQMYAIDEHGAAQTTA